MASHNPHMLLKGKKGLVLSITNEKSIGWAVAKRACDAGAQVGIGGQNERMMRTVSELAEANEGMTGFMVDFSDDAQVAQLVEDVAKKYRKIDFFVHSAAFAPREA